MKKFSVFLIFIIQLTAFSEIRGQSYINTFVQEISQEISSFIKNSPNKCDSGITHLVSFIGFDAVESERFKDNLDTLKIHYKGLKMEYSKDVTYSWMFFRHCDSLRLLEIRKKHYDGYQTVNITQLYFIFDPLNKSFYKEYLIYDCERKYYFIEK